MFYLFTEKVWLEAPIAHCCTIKAIAVIADASTATKIVAAVAVDDVLRPIGSSVSGRYDRCDKD